MSHTSKSGLQRDETQTRLRLAEQREVRRTLVNLKD